MQQPAGVDDLLPVHPRDLDSEERSLQGGGEGLDEGGAGDDAGGGHDVLHARVLLLGQKPEQRS